MFCICFVVVTVKARIAGLDPRLEQAAMDLYANEWQTFRRITLPLVAPGIAAGALLAFSLSFDDFIITNFNSGDVNTFPKFVWVSSLRGIPAQANVIASAMFFLALIAVLVGQAVTRPEEAEGLSTVPPPAPARRQPPSPTCATRRSGSTARRPTPCPALAGDADGRPGRRRRRLHRALDRAARQGARPGRDVVLLEAREVGWAASGRNGGFCSASLTHGLRNGLDRFPDEMPTLERLGPGEPRRHRGRRRAARHRLLASSAPASSPSRPRRGRSTELRELPGLAAQFGGDGWSGSTPTQVRAKVDSPTYLGGVLDRDGVAMVDPARLARGLRAACLRLGVRIHENTPVQGLESRRRRRGAAHAVRRGHGRPGGARHQRLPAAAAPAVVLRRPGLGLRAGDRAAAAEPSARPSAGPTGTGVADAGNLFHYYRVTDDWRILWGGYDAVYHFGGRTDDRLDRNPETFLRLAEHFFDDLPRSWTACGSPTPGAASSTPARGSPRSGARAHGGRVAYAAGYTGLGVGATRFGGQVLLDLLAGRADRAHRAGDGAAQAAAVPARAGALGRCRAHPAGGRQGRRAARAAAGRGCAPWTRVGLGFDS